MSNLGFQSLYLHYWGCIRAIILSSTLRKLFFFFCKTQNNLWVLWGFLGFRSSNFEFEFHQVIISFIELLRASYLYVYHWGYIWIITCIIYNSKIVVSFVILKQFIEYCEAFLEFIASTIREGDPYFACCYLTIGRDP